MLFLRNRINMVAAEFNITAGLLNEAAKRGQFHYKRNGLFFYTFTNSSTIKGTYTSSKSGLGPMPVVVLPVSLLPVDKSPLVLYPS